jgi:selenocysteine lyase/cysteine desulfurase
MAYGAALGLGAAMTYLDSVGMARIEQHIGQLGGYLAAALTDLGAEVVTPLEPSRRAGIITARFSQHDPRTLDRALANAGVITSVRGGGIRFSVDFYNDSGDIDRAVAVLREALE